MEKYKEELIMIDVKILLNECCKRDVREDADLIDSGILDSFGIYLFFSKLEELGIDINIARLDKNILRNVKSIQEYVNSLEREKSLQNKDN